MTVSVSSQSEEWVLPDRILSVEAGQDIRHHPRCGEEGSIGILL